MDTSSNPELTFSGFLQYLNYVLRHKWHVLKACLEWGQIWRGITHDLSKFLPSEALPYAHWFRGNYGVSFSDSGSERARNLHLKRKRAFDNAWLQHQHRNPHHWQYWILREDDGSIVALEMPDHYVIEMVCDWRGAGIALGKPDTWAWWKANESKIVLHPETKKKAVTILKGYVNNEG